jgi:Pyridoxamine 5'-phosphate oxidase
MLPAMQQELLPDPTTPFGERVHRRLREETVIWLSTVARDGTPEPNPVWFLWDGDTFLVYSVAGAHRLRHLRSRPQVALHLDRTETEVGAIVGHRPRRGRRGPPARRPGARVGGQVWPPDVVRAAGVGEALSGRAPDPADEGARPLT